CFTIMASTSALSAERIPSNAISTSKTQLYSSNSAISIFVSPPIVRIFSSSSEWREHFAQTKRPLPFIGKGLARHIARCQQSRRTHVHVMTTLFQVFIKNLTLLPFGGTLCN